MDSSESKSIEGAARHGRTVPPGCLRQDRDLTQRASAGDPVAVAECVARMGFVHRWMRRRYARRGSPVAHPDVDDLTQEVFARVWSRLAEYRAQAPFEAWVARFCALVLLDHVNRRMISPFVASMEGESVERRSIDLDARLDLAEATSVLSIDDRELLLAHAVVGRTFPELARLHGLAPTTIKSRYHRTLAVLRRRASSLGPTRP